MSSFFTRCRPWLMAIVLVSIVGCGTSSPPQRSPSAEDDPARAERAASEAEGVDRAIRQAQEEQARRQGLKHPGAR
jgi:hypothetical protein